MTKYQKRVLKQLEVARFVVTEIEWENEEYVTPSWRIEHPGFEGFSAFLEFKGILAIVDADPQCELAHGNAGALTLLAAVLPHQSILIECSDVSHLVCRWEHLDGWESVTEEDIRRFYPGQYNRWLAEEVQELIEEWLDMA